MDKDIDISSGGSEESVLTSVISDQDNRCQVQGIDDQRLQIAKRKMPKTLSIRILLKSIYILRLQPIVWLGSYLN